MQHLTAVLHRVLTLPVRCSDIDRGGAISCRETCTRRKRLFPVDIVTRAMSAHSSRNVQWLDPHPPLSLPPSLPSLHARSRRRSRPVHDFHSFSRLNDLGSRSHTVGHTMLQAWVAPRKKTISTSSAPRRTAVCSSPLMSNIRNHSLKVAMKAPPLCSNVMKIRTEQKVTFRATWTVI